MLPANDNLATYASLRRKYPDKSDDFIVTMAQALNSPENRAFEKRLARLPTAEPKGAA